MTEKKVWRIAVIPGDGIGTEVVSEGQRVLDALAEDSGGAFAFEWESFPWGSGYYLGHGRMMAEEWPRTPWRGSKASTLSTSAPWGGPGCRIT